MGATLARYADFFALFRDFDGYVGFFHLQDLVDDTTAEIKFFMPFDDFSRAPVPESLDAYIAYRTRATEFIESRNHRIAAHVAAR